MMYGDDINDSIALIIKSENGVVIDSLDVILLKNNSDCISKLVNNSNKILKDIRQNLSWTFFIIN